MYKRKMDFFDPAGVSLFNLNKKLLDISFNKLGVRLK